MVNGLKNIHQLKKGFGSNMFFPASFLSSTLELKINLNENKDELILNYSWVFFYVNAFLNFENIVKNKIAHKTILNCIREIAEVWILAEKNYID